MSRRLRGAAVLAIEWLAVTVAFGSVIAHGAESLRTYVTPTINSDFIFLAAFLLAGLLGLLVESPRALVVLALGMSVGGAAIYAGVLYSPAWLGVTIGTVALQNFVMQQALLVLLWAVIPSLVGALFGHLAGAGLRQRAFIADRPEETARPPWWEQRGQR